MVRKPLPARALRLVAALVGLVCAATLLVLPAPAAAVPHGGDCSLHGGRQVLQVADGGREYPVLAYLPSRRHHSLPLVLNLHGSTHDGANQEQLSQIEPIAERNGFAVLAPDGGIPDGAGYSWNVPGVPLASGHTPPADARDDVAFLAAVIHAAEQQYCVNPHQVYVTGHSGGARMASALACARADLLAAIAPVSGLRAGPADALDPSRPDGSCRPTQPVSVASFHGTADPLNPYAGGGGPYWGYSVPVAVREWQRLDGCSGRTGAARLNTHAAVEFTVHCAERTEVRSYVISGAGHVWPGSPYNDTNDPRNDEIRATSTIWSFFAQHRRA